MKEMNFAVSFRTLIPRVIQKKGTHVNFITSKSYKYFTLPNQGQSHHGSNPEYI